MEKRNNDRTLRIEVPEDVPSPTRPPLGVIKGQIVHGGGTMRRIFGKGLWIALCFGFWAGPANAVNLPYQDENFGCISEEDSNRYIRDFNINFRSFGGRELCDAAVDTKKLLNDIMLIELGEFAPPEAIDGSPFLQGFIRGSYYEYSRRMTRGVRRGHDVPYATAYNRGGYFTMQDGWATLTSLGRVGTFIHEARHTDGYRHTRCTTGPYSRSFVSGCDSTLRYGGSHGIEMEYYARVVVRGVNFHPVYQSMARLMAIGRGNWVFNETVIAQRETLVAVDSDSGLPVHVDGADVRERIGPALGDGVLKRTSYGATYFFGDHARALDLYAIDQGPVEMQDDYSYFKLLNGTRDNLPGMIDLEEFDVGTVRFLVALTGNGRLYTYTFHQASWTSLEPTRAINGAERLVITAPDGSRGLFLVTQAGEIFPYRAMDHSLGAALAEAWPEDIEKFVVHEGRTLALRTDGRLVEADGTDFAPLAGRTFDAVESVPMYDAFVVQR